MPTFRALPTGGSRSSTVPRRVGRALTAAISLLVAACAAPPPMVVNPAFTNPSRVPAKSVATARGCRLDVAEIVDARRAPEMLGIVGRAVKAPDDRAAWLRSVVAGLDARGFSVTFDTTAPAGSRAVVVQMTLTNKDANVVWRVVAQRPGAPALVGDYRGAVSTVNWAGSPSELRGLVDQAFAKSLDSMAPDLHGLCGAASVRGKESP
jgi:hypothetical protein